MNCSMIGVVFLSAVRRLLLLNAHSRMRQRHAGCPRLVLLISGLGYTIFLLF